MTVLVDRTPKVVQLAADPDEYLILSANLAATLLGLRISRNDAGSSELRRPSEGLEQLPGQDAACKFRI